MPAIAQRMPRPDKAKNSLTKLAHLKDKSVFKPLLKISTTDTDYDRLAELQVQNFHITSQAEVEKKTGGSKKTGSKFKKLLTKPDTGTSAFPHPFCSTIAIPSLLLR